MSWLSAVPAVLATVGILVVPGLVVALLLRQRGLRLLALAPAISVSLIAVAALGAPFVGIRWGLLPVGILAVVAAVAAAVWSRFVVPRSRVSLRPAISIDWSIVVALVVPALVIAFVLLRSIGDPDFISQRYDNFFHLNGVQYVLDTGNASPLWLGSMTSPGGIPFYPSGWHALVSLVVSTSGASVAIAANATIIVVAAFVWPLSAVFFVRTVLGRGRVVTAAAGALSAAFPAFPFLPLHYGVLYPLFLGLAVAPVGLALAWLLLRPGKVERRGDIALLLLLTVPGIAVAHPGALMAVVALSVPFVLARLAHWFRSSEGSRRKILVVVVAVAYLGAGVVLLSLVRPPSNQIYWPVIESLPQAVGEVVSAAVYQYPMAFTVAALLLVGAYSVVRRGGYVRWVVLGMAVVGCGLYVIVASSPWETLRFWFTAPWYNNAPRLASIWVIAVLPLAALGASTIVSWILRQRPFSAVRRGVSRLPIAASVVVVLLITLLSQGAAIRQASADIEFTYQVREGGPILSPDEIALIEDLPDLVPEDAVIAGDPWTGASFAYGLSGRRVLMPHLLMDMSADAKIINTRLATQGDSPAVCKALEETGVEYVLDFSADGDFQDNPDDYSGLEGLDRSPYVTLVESKGDAKLYEITACGGTR
ncbi:DUF6541 family protein [Microbacterium phyllosphaerae]|uniref:DUF6541 family protein n=1 Tax=Microbacterium phyllosphaerae TaxID=124798 RepID=UPI000EA14FD3|nr:DUF6541 family protein [Microbacterium phyllosphaerae]